MKPRPDLEELAAEASPEVLADVLTRLRWEEYGGQAESYSRWRSQDDDVRLLLPLNSTTADFGELLREAVYRLTTAEPRALELLRSAEARQREGDELKFRKDVPTRLGGVAWPLGEDLVRAAREALVAGAKATVSRIAYYGNKSGRFAKQYLEACMMGQTEVGSYVITAYTPVTELFYEKESREGEPILPELGAHSGRDITLTLATALGSTQLALEHFKSNNGSFAGFEEGVKSGVSRELLESVHALASGGEGGEVQVLWSPSTSLPAGMEVKDKFQFDGSSVPVLRSAIDRLATLTPSEYVRLVGWVKIVSRPKRGLAGVVSLRVLAGSSAPTVRIRLTEGQFEIAAKAVGDDAVLVVSGRLEREGRFYWLYDASEVQVSDLPETGRRRRKGADQLLGQRAFDE